MIERAMALAANDTLLPEDFEFPDSKADLSGLLDRGAAKELPLEEMERAYVRRVVEAHKGNKAAAARVLRINRRTLYRKMGQ